MTKTDKKNPQNTENGQSITDNYYFYKKLALHPTNFKFHVNLLQSLILILELPVSRSFIVFILPISGYKKGVMLHFEFNHIIFKTKYKQLSIAYINLYLFTFYPFCT